jgi:hypothetical protein
MRTAARWITIILATGGALAFVIGLTALPVNGWAIWWVILTLFLIDGTRKNSIAYVWMVFGALSWMIFLGPTVRPAWRLLGSAAVVHAFAARAGWATALIPFWFIFGLSAQIVAIDALDHWFVGRAGGRVNSSEVAVLCRWILAFAVFAAGLGYFTQRAWRSHIEKTS